MKQFKYDFPAFLSQLFFRRLKGKQGKSLLALLLCGCMLFSLCSETVQAAGITAEPTDEDLLVEDSRVADPDTTDTYIDKLLSDKNGSRYAGRVWTDKSVFAYGADQDKGGVEGNELKLDNETDGYEGEVGYDADFMHVYSALASSQVVNEFPATPIDLVIVFDMSGSMGQDTRFGIDKGSNTYVEHDSNNDNVEKKNENEKGEDTGDTWNWKEESKGKPGIPMEDRIKYSRIQITLDAINQTIENLMEQNLQNRVAVIGYGANATVLMPLAHWKTDNTKKEDDSEHEVYLTVSGMETLYYPGDLTTDGNDWYWINNRDTCYTVKVDAQMNTYTDGRVDDSNVEASKSWTKHTRTVSNNIYGGEEKTALEKQWGGNGKVKAFPGVETQSSDTLTKSAKDFQNQSDTIQKEKYLSGHNDNEKGSTVVEKNKLKPLMKDTRQLKADEYVGYYTNTQGGIYLGYKQLADTDATTYSEPLASGKTATVARIPSAIIMSDGGANIILNPMGTTGTQQNETFEPGKPKEPKIYSYDQWSKEFGKWDDEGHKYPSDELSNEYLDKYYRLHNKDASNDKYQNIGDEWYNVWLPSVAYSGEENYKGLPSIYNEGADVYQDGTLSTGPDWPNQGVLLNRDNNLDGTPGAVMEVLLTASYMSKVADTHYKDGWTKEKGEKKTSPESYEGRSLSTYTMNVDTRNVPQWGRWRLFPTLDPKGHPLSDINSGDNSWNTNTKELGENYGLEGWGTQGNIYHGSTFQALKTAWNDISDNKDIDVTAASNGSIKVRIRAISGSHTYKAGSKDNDVIQITNQDVIDNIAYNDEFYDVDSLDLSQTFDTILSEITGTVFIPIAGDNDAGADNSITYQDPIGDYMEIKNGSITATPYHTGEFDTDVEEVESTYDMAMLLFGEMHGLVRTGVYDYNFNQAHQSGGNFTMGWYRLTEGKDPDDPKSWTHLESGGSWENGDVYHLDSETLQSYVPIEGLDDSKDISDQQKNTVYTVYRFACNTDDGSAVRRNPIYGELPKNLSEEEQLKLPGVYKLNDIRVWVEEYGDYKDSDGAITPNPGAYDASLYCNVPAAAVPTQVAEISLGPEGVRSYKANIDDPERKDECTPLRLFYAVGLQEKLILRDEEGNQTGVDVSAISEEYIKDHTTENGDIYFISNYYSETPYDGYITDEEARTRGDPAVSFSPALDNRYYLFQKPLPLYAHAYRWDGSAFHAVDKKNDEWGEGDKTQGGNGETTWEDEKSPAAWSGGYFMGVYGNESDFQRKLGEAKKDGYITDIYGNEYKVREDGIVFLENDLLKHVTSKSDGSYEEGSTAFNSDDWFFILLEFYLPNDDIPKDKDGNEIDDGVTQGGEAVQFVVTRKGSEFGSGLSSEKIKNGDMLCWTDVNGNFPENLHYNSQTETGDKTRGEPTYEKLTSTGDELRKHLEECGFTGEKLEDEADYWESVQNGLGGLLKDESGNPISKEKFGENFSFTVAAKPGGLRTGDMAQNLGSKLVEEAHKNGVGNTTQTANNYYVPTVSDTSGIGSDAVIDNYLGNNGRLEIPNQELVVTKTLTPPEEFTLTDAQKNKDFYYQLYLKGVTGERSAIKVQYNPYAKVWQRKMGAVDVLTDNSGLLLNNNNQRVLFDKEAGDETGTGENQGRLVVKGSDGNLYYADEDGNPTENKCKKSESDLCYVYLPPNTEGVGGEESSRRVYEDPQVYGHGGNLSNAGRITYVPKDMKVPEDQEADGITRLVKESYKEATDTRPAGTRAYYVTNAELIPVSEVNGNGEDKAPEDVQDSSWKHDGNQETDHEKLDQFTVLVRKPNEDAADFGEDEDYTGAVGGKDKILSPYQTRTQYLTQKLVFGYATLPSGESGIIPENGNAEAHFVNDKRKGGLVVFKTVTGDAGDKTKEWHFRVELSDPTINGQYGDMFFVDGVAEFTLKHGESFHAENLPVGVTHKVTEVEADTDGYDTSSSGETGTIPEEGSNKAAFVNDKTTGGLTVSKAVTGDDGEREREWHFKVELDDKTVNGQYGDMFFIDGVAEFTLKHGESFRARGLPPGVGYTVSELEADQDDYVTLMRGETGTIPPEGSVTAYFINDRTTAHTNDTGASLTVSKTVTGNAGDKEKEWHFRMELSDRTVNGQYGGLAFKNGAADFTLKDGETVTVTDLPQGVTYTVTELEANQDGYTTSSTGESGTVPQSGGISAGFINHKDLTTPPAAPVTPPSVTTTTPPPERTATTLSTRTQGGLTVTKTVSGSAGDKDHVWHFSVMLSDKSISGQYGDMVFENGVAVFTLKHGGSFSATGLEEGVSYTVTEAEANQNGYVTSSTGNTGTIPGNAVTYARFENRRDSNPKTGMNTRIEPLLVLMGLGIVGLVAVPVVLKNRHKDSKPQSRNERFDKDRR